VVTQEAQQSQRDRHRETVRHFVLVKNRDFSYPLAFDAPDRETDRHLATA